MFEAGLLVVDVMQFSVNLWFESVLMYLNLFIVYL